ncbi:hypothetical protein ACFVU0_15840 [Streptomyces sp. NPDC058122]|uniref:hypothetical protein n=1 Tax=Streptomyces sp. NPDC058122 TaxID=3346349 RepID=UPI0036ECA96B
MALALHDLRDESDGTREAAVAVCLAVTMFVCWSALEYQTLHERGRPVRAVVTALRPSTGVYDAGTEAMVADASRHRPLGAIDAGDLAVGSRLTVTVDPRGRYGVIPGPPPATPGWLWTTAAVIAALQALPTAPIGFSAARERERRWRRSG